MSTTHDTGPRSNGNPILREFRNEVYEGAARNTTKIAAYWATKLADKKPLAFHWLYGATVSQQVFAARVLYRYAAVFGGVA